MPQFHNDAMVQEIQVIKNRQAKQQVGTRPFGPNSRNDYGNFYWKRLILMLSLTADLSKKQGNKLAEIQVTIFIMHKVKLPLKKQEFVTCGGIRFKRC